MKRMSASGVDRRWGNHMKRTCPLAAYWPRLWDNYGWRTAALTAYGTYILYHILFILYYITLNLFYILLKVMLHVLIALSSLLSRVYCFL